MRAQDTISTTIGNTGFENINVVASVSFAALDAVSPDQFGSCPPKSVLERGFLG